MKIAIIDSGIHPGHPHVGQVAGGVSLVSHDFLDSIGHGTAVAGAIREKAPQAELYAVKVFDRRLSTKFEIILRAIEWCAANRIDIINLSLATERALPAVEAVIVGPAPMAVAVPVAADDACPRDEYRWNGSVFLASPYPRSIPGVPRERNLHGLSFAVANMTGFVARALETSGRARLRAELIRAGTP